LSSLHIPRWQTNGTNYHKNIAGADIIRPFPLPENKHEIVGAGVLDSPLFGNGI
jgi:hypothetical protein